jgi:hypothetical protein
MFAIVSRQSRCIAIDINNNFYKYCVLHCLSLSLWICVPLSLPLFLGAANLAKSFADFHLCDNYCLHKHNEKKPPRGIEWHNSFTCDRAHGEN